MNKPRGKSGPITPNGKLISSRNAAKHNCTSTSLIVEGENPEDFDLILKSVTAEFRPETEMQKTTVMQAARAMWDLARVNREFDKSQQILYHEQANMREWTSGQYAEYERMLRYRIKAERAYARAFQAVEFIRKVHLQAEQRVYWEKLQDARLVQSGQRIKLSSARLTHTTDRATGLDKSKEDKAKHSRPVPWPVSMPPLAQIIELRVVEGVTENLITATAHPSTEEMLLQAAVAPPFTPVTRALEFPDGVPAEYAWVNAPGITRAGIVWTQRFASVAEWRAHIHWEATQTPGRFYAVRP